MQKRGIFIVCLIVFGVHVSAQHVSHAVLVPLANTYSTGKYCISQSVGEPVVEYIHSDYFDLTQGFQQPSIKGVGFIEEDKGKGVEVYPNPVISNLTVEFIGSQTNEYHLIIFGLNGSIYRENTYTCIGTGRKEYLDLSDFSRGTYFVRIVAADESIIRTFKIEKL